MLTAWLNSPVLGFLRQPEAAAASARGGKIVLRIGSPPAEVSDKPPRLHDAALRGDLAALADTPLEQLKRLRGELGGLNHAELPLQDRLDQTRQALVCFLPLLQQAMRRHGKESGVPDSRLRRKTLEHCAVMLAMLGHAYAQAFRHHYEQPDAHFASVIDEARQCACRVFELARLEQRVRAMRYKPLRPGAWSLVNTLFHILWAHDQTEVAVPVLESAVYAAHAGRVTKASTLFCALQVSARFDLLRWPVAMQSLLIGYLDAHMGLVRMYVDRDGPARSTRLLAYRHGRQPAGARLADTGEPALEIDWSRLAARVHEDCRALVLAGRSGDASLAPRSLRLLTGLESLSLAQLFLKSLQRLEHSGDAGGPDVPVPALRLCVGFDIVRQLLMGLMAREPSAPYTAPEATPQTAAAGAAHAMSAWSGRTLGHGWSMHYQDARRVLLDADEDTLAADLAVGDLVAYGVGECDRERPRLAVVRRLHRARPGRLNIELDRLAKYAEPVEVAPLSEGRTYGSPRAALMVFDPDHGINLLLPPTPPDLVATGGKLRLRFRGGWHEVTLGSLKYVSGGLYLFHIGVRMSQLGLCTPPTYSVPY